MEKIRFFPMDASYKIIDGKAIIHIYGKMPSGEQICVTDSNFEPSFWAVLKEDADLAEKLLKIKIEGEDPAFVTRAEKINKKYLGKNVAAIMIFTNLPSSVPIIRESIKGWDAIKSTHEFDILFARRYLIDKGILLFTLHEAEGDFQTNQRSKIPFFSANSINQLGAETLHNPKVLAFDIETYSPIDFEIDAEKNPIIMLSFYGEGLKKVFVWKKFKCENEYVEFVDSEVQLIEKFKEVIETYKPDILTGYFSDGFDLPYIRTRAAKYKIKLDIGLDYSELRQKTGRESAIEINGIAHLDIFKFIRKIMGPSMDTYTYDLNAVASELLNEKKHEVLLSELPHAWDNDNGKLDKFCEYCMHDSVLTYNLAIKMLPTIIEMVKIVGLPIYDINRMGFSQLVEWFALRQAPLFNEISPNKPNNNEITARRLQTYEGGFVYEPKPGLYKNIVVFDFRSLYPTIIGSHNIGLDTIDCECCKDTSKKIEVGSEIHWFCQKKKGFIPTLIEDLITRRMRIKEIMKDSSDQMTFLDARQTSLKLLANSFYGYLGFFGARWYSIESAKSVTAWGRNYIQKVIERASAQEFRVLYSDTDSVFLCLDGKTEQDARLFAKEINKELPGLMELDFEGFYASGIFVSAKMGPFGAKKKYALMSRSGVLKVRGFETVRRNWSNIAKEVQETVLDIILKEDDPQKALDYVKSVINDLRQKKIPLSQVIMHTQLQKEVLDYAAKGPHVAAAQRMINKGRTIGPGSMIKYIVTQGSDIIRNRVKLPDEVKDKDYDADYYINNQVVPAVERIFAVLGHSERELLETKEQTKLAGFF